MGIAVYPEAASGLTVQRFPAKIGNPANIPAGLTLRNTISSSTSFAAGALPAQVFVIMIGGGGGGSNGGTSTQGGGGGGGGACIGWIDVPTDRTSYVVIGAGGTGATGASNANPGGRGGSTTFAGYIAYGGGGGCAGTARGTDLAATTLPLGAGGGCGATNGTNITNGNIMTFPDLAAPWTTNKPKGTIINYSAGQQGLGSFSDSSEYNNYVGGGAGRFDQTGGNFINGGNGLTGGGSSGTAVGGSVTGGNSSRDGGTTFTFTGGTSTNQNGSSGAGFLGNGVSSTAGLGGGGGAGQYNTNTGAAGAVGCMLIYY